MELEHKVAFEDFSFSYEVTVSVSISVLAVNTNKQTICKKQHLWLCVKLGVRH